MNFPVIIKDGHSLITFISECEGTYANGALCMSILSDMMVKVGAGSAEVVDQSVPVIVRNVQGQLFRNNHGLIETSFNGGELWMSTTKSVEWFDASTKSPIVEAPMGKFLG